MAPESERAKLAAEEIWPRGAFESEEQFTTRAERIAAIISRHYQPMVDELIGLRKRGIMGEVYGFDYEETSGCPGTGNPPTLTCSEVVERLPMSAREFRQKHYVLPASLDTYLKAEEFAEAYAAAILHSWRERRVQEPSGSEICRKQAEYFSQLMESAKRNHNFSAFTLNEERKRVCDELAETIERATEQIRKGAKHE